MPTEGPRGLALLLTRRWIGYLTLAVVFAVACVGLGMWQFARLDEARTQMARITANYERAPVPLKNVIDTDPLSADRTRTNETFDPANTWIPVEVVGTYLVDEQIVVRSRPLNGQVGFEVLTPLRLPDGRIFVVNRGWIPSGVTTADVGVIPEPPHGEVSVVARLREGEPALAGRDASSDSVPTINLDMIRGMWGEQTLTQAYGLLVSETPSVTPRPEALPKPELNEGPHLSYALQWLLFAVMGFVGLGLAVRNERRIKLGLKEADNSPLLSRKRTDEDDEDAAIESSAGRV